MPLTTSASATAKNVVGVATNSLPAERASGIISVTLLVLHPFRLVMRSSLNHLNVNVSLLLILLTSM